MLGKMINSPSQQWGCMGSGSQKTGIMLLKKESIIKRDIWEIRGKTCNLEADVNRLDGSLKLDDF